MSDYTDEETAEFLRRSGDALAELADVVAGKPKPMTKWRVKITTVREVEADYSGTSTDSVINLAHGPDARTVQEESEVIAVEVEGRWFEAPPF
jgi:hypothetical protein